MNAYWKIGLFLAWTLSCFAGGWRVGDGIVHAEWTAAQLKQERAVAAAQVGVLEQEHKDETITLGVSDAYQKNLAALNGRYDAYELRASSAGDSLPAAAPADAGRHAAACPAGLSRSNKQDILKLMKAADEQTARLVACQAWVKGHE